MRRRSQQQPGGKRPGGAGAKCDKHIHIARTGTNGREACAPETRAEPKFHEARQAKLHPTAWHPILPETHADHADQKGRREKPSQHHIAPFTRQRAGGGFFPCISRAAAQFISGSFHRDAQSRFGNPGDGPDMRLF